MSPSHAQLAAENLFLREPLACYVERESRRLLLCWRAKSRLTSLATPRDGRGSCTERGSNPGAANGSLQIIESVGLMRKGFAGARNPLNLEFAWAAA